METQRDTTAKRDTDERRDELALVKRGVFFPPGFIYPPARRLIQSNPNRNLSFRIKKCYHVSQRDSDLSWNPKTLSVTMTFMQEHAAGGKMFLETFDIKLCKRLQIMFLNVFVALCGMQRRRDVCRTKTDSSLNSYLNIIMFPPDCHLLIDD